MKMTLSDPGMTPRLYNHSTHTGTTLVKPHVTCHRQCAIWAPRAFIDTKTDQLRNIMPEITRARRLTCSHCNRSGAAIGCFNPKCLNTFHFPCALKDFCFMDYKNFILICRSCSIASFKNCFSVDLYRSKRLAAFFDKITRSRREEPLELDRVSESFLGMETEITGLEKQWEQLKECLLLPVIHPELKSRIRFPRGLLLYGPTGNGKTFLMKSIAKRCFFPSDSTTEQRGHRFAFFRKFCIGNELSSNRTFCDVYVEQVLWRDREEPSRFVPRCYQAST